MIAVIDSADRKLIRRLSKNLRAEMGRRDLCQSDIARLSGLNHVYIHNVLHERVNPTITRVARIADALGLSLDELISDAPLGQRIRD